MSGTGDSPDPGGLQLVPSSISLIYRLVIVAAQFFHRVSSLCQMHFIPAFPAMNPSPLHSQIS
jgi:hypothetical protein